MFAAYGLSRRAKMAPTPTRDHFAICYGAPEGLLAGAPGLFPGAPVGLLEQGVSSAVAALSDGGASVGG